jgi:hypothetical protein
MQDFERRERAARMLEAALRDLARVAAEMQAKGVDTQPLTKPAIAIQEVAIYLLDVHTPNRATAAASDP